MSPKQRIDKNGETFADKVLKKYIAYISEEVYKKYGLGDGCNNLPDIDAKKLAWTTTHTWDEAKEKFLIERTKLHIRLLDSHDSNSTNLQFIKALVNRIASYLSEFCQHGPKRSRNLAKSILVDAIYKNNSYVRGLEVYQAERRANNQPRTQKSVADKKKRERIAAQHKNHYMEHQVQRIFIETATYRKK